MFTSTTQRRAVMALLGGFKKKSSNVRSMKVHLQRRKNELLNTASGSLRTMTPPRRLRPDEQQKLDAIESKLASIAAGKAKMRHVVYGYLDGGRGGWVDDTGTLAPPRAGIVQLPMRKREFKRALNNFGDAVLYPEGEDRQIGEMLTTLRRGKHYTGNDILGEGTFAVLPAGRAVPRGKAAKRKKFLLRVARLLAQQQYDDPEFD